MTYDNTYAYTNAGAKLRYQKKKFNLAIGAQWQEASLNGNIPKNGKDTTSARNITTYFPTPGSSIVLPGSGTLPSITTPIPTACHQPVTTPSRYQQPAQH